MSGSMRSDSPICRRIVLAFIDFLKSVEPAPGADLEGLDVARECLEEVFVLDQSAIDHGIQPGFLADLFTSRVSNEQIEPKSVASPTNEETTCGTSASQKIENSNVLVSSNSEDHDLGSHLSGQDPKDELLGKFLTSLDRINFFNNSPDGNDEDAQVSKAVQLFNDAISEMGSSQEQSLDLGRLSETFKSKGNQSMQKELYPEALELYTCAIVLCETNAVYYCNRAAAYTQLHCYTEAIQDCLKSIEINPRYSKAYSRLGMAYYCQGNYTEALNLGFLKALQLDPSNTSVKEGIQAARQKLMEQYQSEGAYQNTRPTTGQEPGAQSTGSTNHTTTFHGPIPPEFANLFRSMASESQGNQAHDSGNPQSSEEPEIRVGANVSFGVGEAAEASQHISATLRSVMEMVSSNLQQRTHGGGTDQT